MVRFAFIIFTSTILFFSISSFAGNSISLSPKSVADLILKQSFKAQEINLTAQQSRLAKATIDKAYDFTLAMDTGYQDSKFESSTNTYLLRTQTATTNLTLTKPFFTGTSLSLAYSRSSDKPEVSTAATTVPLSLTTDTVGIILTQNLWKNFFGSADRADLKNASFTYESLQVARVNQLQDLVLEGIRAYWAAYVAQETFQESLNSRNRYLKLVEEIKKKTNYGYSNPGELSQAQAELETREQKVKSSSVTYLATIDSLITTLKLPPGSDIKFDVPTEAPAPPQVLESKNVENLRSLKASKLKLQAADESYFSSKSKSYPDLSLVAKAYRQGLEEKAEDAQSEMVSGSRPKYYIGVQFQYTFGSGYYSEDVLNKKSTRDLAESQLSRSRMELQDKQNDLIRKVQSTYSIAQSTKVQRSFREKASQELSKSYNQGRTDISLLITALNNYFDSEVQMTKALGDYQIALNEWAAFQDQLIPDHTEAGSLTAPEGVQ